MKKLLFLGLVLLLTTVSFAQVGIGTQTPAPSAILDLTATNKGFLPPRLTTTQRDAINNPAVGLTIYNTTENCLQWYRGANIWHNACGSNLYQQYPPNTNFCNIPPTAIVEVTNATTGKTWMDRNLGANRAATSSLDAQAYGSLYQWGRVADGHQCVNRFVGDGAITSNTTTTLSTTITPLHGDFIIDIDPVDPINWLTFQDNNLWQGVNGINNPCPIGYRLPTKAEFDAEIASWGSANAAGAFASPLKLPTAGYRGGEDGIIYSNASFYATQTISGSNDSQFLIFDSSSAGVFDTNRAFGTSVRCIKE